MSSKEDIAVVDDIELVFLQKYNKAISKMDKLIQDNTKSIEDIKASIIDACERDGCKMLKIVGNCIE